MPDKGKRTKTKSPPFGKIIRRTWLQNNFRGLPRDLRLMLCYMWTNEHGKGGTGLYHCSVPTMADDLDVDISVIRQWFYQVRVYSMLTDVHRVNLHKFKHGDVYEFTAAQSALVELGTNIELLHVHEWGVYDAGWFMYDFDNRIIYLPRQLDFDPPDNANVVKGMINRVMELPKSILWHRWVEALRPHASKFKLNMPAKMVEALKDVPETTIFANTAEIAATGKGLPNNGKGYAQKGEIQSRSQSLYPNHNKSLPAAKASALFQDIKDDDFIDACVGAFVALREMYNSIAEKTAISKSKYIVKIFWNLGIKLTSDEMEHATGLALQKCNTVRGVGAFLKVLDSADEATQVVQIAQDARRKVFK